MPRMSQVTWAVEIELWKRGYRYIAGLDEAGRGALAGPVVAAAVVLPPYTCLEHMDDSKRLSRQERERLLQQIQPYAIAIGVGIVAADMIDAINIRRGTLLAMQSAIEELRRRPDYLLIDGCDEVPWRCSQQAVVRGDQTVGSIAAASIVAKVTRDRLMASLDAMWPGYGFAQHKGYGTSAHLHAIRALGPSAIHRRTFRGVTSMADRHG
jgi:ribonuclease HII